MQKLSFFLIFLLFLMSCSQNVARQGQIEQEIVHQDGGAYIFEEIKKESHIKVKKENTEILLPNIPDKKEVQITGDIIIPENYPNLAFDEGVNATLMKNIVYYIPEEYYNGIKIIIFTNKGISCEDNKDKIGCYHTNWDIDDICYDSTIWLFGIELYNWKQENIKEQLLHELGHHNCFCKLNYRDNSEKCAEDFRINIKRQ